MSKHGALGTMDPNSAHQLWSRWTVRVVPSGVKRPEFAQVKLAAAKFGRLVFGSATAMRVSHLFERGRTVFVIEVRTEGHPVHDPAFAAWISGEWKRWALKGFGAGTDVAVESKLEAGDRQDGKPRDQMIMIESLAIPVE